MTQKSVIFPFTALVGQEEMKRALLLNAIDPDWWCDDYGTPGNSQCTAVRALAALLPVMNAQNVLAWLKCLSKA